MVIHIYVITELFLLTYCLLSKWQLGFVTGKHDEWIHVDWITDHADEQWKMYVVLITGEKCKEAECFPCFIKICY